MKIVASALSFAVLSLLASSSGALCQDRGAQQVASLKAATTDDLPDAPSSIGTQSATPQQEGLQPPPVPIQMEPIGPVPPLMTMTRLTLRNKFTIYTHQTFGPPALVFPALGAGLRMIKPPDNYPHDWKDGGGAFGRLYGSTLATQTTKRTAQFLTGAVLREDPRYLPAPPGSNVGKRVFHAISYTFVDRNDSGSRTVAFSNFAGAAASGFVGMAYLPNGFNDATHAEQRALSEFMAIGVSNIVGEFAPQLAPIFRRLHIPKVMPAWWVPEMPPHP